MFTHNVDTKLHPRGVMLLCSGNWASRGVDWSRRSVRTDDGEEVHVLVSPVRSQGGDDSPSSPSRLPDSVLKAMCNMGKAFLSRWVS